MEKEQLTAMIELMEQMSSLLLTIAKDQQRLILRFDGFLQSLENDSSPLKSLY